MLGLEILHYATRPGDSPDAEFIYRNCVYKWDPTSHVLGDFGPCNISIGMFDGVHLGHQQLLNMAGAEEHPWGETPDVLIVTFMQDPDEYFGKKVDKLMSDEARLCRLSTFGAVVAIPLDCGVFDMQPEDFLLAISRLCTPRDIYVGENFRFGAGGKGGLDDLRRYAELRGNALHAMKLVERRGEPVSASRIRASVHRGDVDDVLFCTGGRPYSVSGTIVHGRGQGTGFGFATANVELEPHGSALPCEGVYGGFGRVDGVLYPAAVNVGKPKSFEEADCELEAHLLDFEGDLYGRRITVFFIAWLRPQRVFESQEELIETVMGNIEYVREKADRWLEMSGTEMRIWPG